MIIAIVAFDLPKPATGEEMSAVFQLTATKYLGLSGLLRKSSVVNEDGRGACAATRSASTAGQAVP